MSDTLENALRSASAGSTGLAPPVTINPLAGIGAAQQLVQGMQTLDKTYAEQRAGQAFLKSIDPQTGKPDQALLMQNLRADPSTAYAAQQAAQRGQTLDADTYKLHSTRLASLYSETTDLLSRFPDGVPLSEVQSTVQRAVARGDIPAGEADRVLQTFSDNPRQNSKVLTQGLFRNMSTREQLERTYGTQQTVGAGGDTHIINVPAPTGTPGPVITVPHSTDPNATTKTTVMRDKNGNVTTDPSAAVTTQEETVPITAVPGTVAPGSPQSRPRIVVQGGAPVPPTTPIPAGAGAYVPRPRAGAPAATGGAPGAPAPAPAAGGPIVPAPATPPPPTPAGGPGGPVPPSPAPAGGAPAGGPAPAPAPAGPGGGGAGLPAGAPAGVEDRLKADREAYRGAQERQPVLQRQAQNLNQAYQLLKVLSTGKTTEATNALFNMLGAMNLLPPGAKRDVANYEEYRKLAEMAVLDAAGNGTDMARQMQHNANPGTGLSTPANLEITRVNLGRTLQEIATYKAYEAENPGLGGPNFKKHAANIPATTDPRGFLWDSYSQPEKDRILASVKGDPVADEMLHTAIGMRKKLNLQIPLLTPPPAPRPGAHSALISPSPPPNLLAMGGPSPNALAG